MAISDIPEYVQAEPGDLISAQNWNYMQQLARNSLRIHQHTLPIGTAQTDSAATDVAYQIGTNEIAPGAVTSAQLAAGAVVAGSIANNAVQAGNIAAGAVTTAAIATNAVTSQQLAFQRISSGSLSLAPGASSETVVQTSAPSPKTTVYFPTMTILSSTGTGISDVSAEIVYRQAVGASTVDIYIRIINSGAATAGIFWEVLTFAQ